MRTAGRGYCRTGGSGWTWESGGKSDDIWWTGREMTMMRVKVVNVAGDTRSFHFM